MSRLSCSYIFCLLLVLSACSKTDNEELEIPKFVSRQGHDFRLHNGFATLTVSPQKGGRVIGLKANDVELLALEPKDAEKVNSYGSVLWSSPQSEWNWPPLASLNTSPYSVGCDSNKTAIVLTSEIEPKTGYQFVKYYSLGDKPETFKMRYKIINHSDKAKDVAVIENTRVEPAGLVFFPKGDTEANSGIFYPLEIQILDGTVWHRFAPEKIGQDHHKLMMDGKEGWLAYQKRSYLLVKRFQDVLANQSPETEREIEIFGHTSRSFAEIKHQSALHYLKPGESFEWEVEWQVKKLPKETNIQFGSADLLKIAREPQ
jgi:Domain of unknown function (DUF4380)